MTTPSRELKIAVADTRLARQWKNDLTTWTQLLHQLQDPHISHITAAQYHTMSKAKQGDTKDVGGFVGGHLQHGLRRNGHVLSRSILCLDADSPPVGMLEALPQVLQTEWATYTTASHTTQTPRFRIIIPLTRDVTPDEYTAIGRRVAADLGMDYFDDTTYEPHRLMYWPLRLIDGEYQCIHNPGPWMDPDTVLARYDDWRDVTTWPTSSRQRTIVANTVDRQADPNEKPGLVGAFCRAYTIDDAITTFLGDTYRKSSQHDNRYTYIHGESSNGVVTYDGKFSYSHHSTDPAGGQTCNSFDLVRIHLYGGEDDGIEDTIKGKNRPSYKAMIHMVQQDGRTKLQLQSERAAQAAEEFGDILINPTPQTTGDETNATTPDWRTELAINQNGKVIDSLGNQVLILRNDPLLQGISYNELANRIEVAPGAKLPWTQLKTGWTDTDSAQLKVYIEKAYGLYGPTKTKEALMSVTAERSFHPVREYLDNLPDWDGVSRVDTLFIDYLGAEDNVYTRAVARKLLVAAIARVKNPGIKFDYVPIIQGPQGVGKSTIFAKLAGEWFSDSLAVTDMRDKTGAEKLQGCWIMEMGELAGMRKMEVEVVKSFISTQDDRYRAAYGTFVESHPRQCVIVGTTNAENGFLRDLSGNRRFLAIPVTGEGSLKAWELTPATVAQMWAEALHRYREGEPLNLTGKAADIAEHEQNQAIETDERLGWVAEFLDTPITDDWYELTLVQRRRFLAGESHVEFGGQPIVTQRRMHVTNAEIWCECFHRSLSDMRPADSYAIGAIMKKLDGWDRTSRYVRSPVYGKQRVYERTDGDQPSF